MNVISGTMAADGEACKTMNTGSPNHSVLLERPMAMPASTPPRPVSSTPTASAGIVSPYASRNVPSASISPKAAIVWLKLGNAGLTGTRPAHSQKTRTSSTERTRRARGPVTALTTPTGTKEGMASAARPLDVLHRFLEWVQVPEVLDVQRRGVVLDLAGGMVELEVLPCRLRAPAVLREQVLLGSLLVVGQYLLFQLGRDIGGKPEPLAFFHHVRGILVDLTPYGQGLFEQDLHRLLVLLQPLSVAEEHLVARSGLRQRQDVELSWRLAHHIVLVRDVEHGRLDVSAQQRIRANLRAGHVADLTELDSLFLLDESGQCLGARPPRVHRDRLAVEGLPVGVGGLVDHGEVPQGLELAEDPEGSRRAFDQAVRRTKPHVGLSADDGLVRKVLVGQLGDLDLHAALTHVLQGDEQVEGLDRLDVAQRDPDEALVSLARVRPLATLTTRPEPECGDQ